MTTRNDYRTYRAQDVTTRHDAEVSDTFSAPPVAVPARRMNSAHVFVIVVLTISMVGLLYLVQTSHVAGLGYKVSSLERERNEKSLENQRLTYQIAQKQALPEIEQVALEDLRMQPMGDHIYLTVHAPASAELATPTREEGRKRSLGERIWDRLTGEAEVNHPVPSEVAP
jgi:cell division protein FtsL